MLQLPPIPSTFLQAYVPPIFMAEDDEVKGFQSVQGSNSSFSDNSDSDLDIIDKLKATDEYKELMSLKKLRTLKLSTGDVRHEGYQCDGCGQEPIMGVRYHCQDCPSQHSIDFCSLCNERRITLGSHHPTHSMQALSCPQTAKLEGSPSRSSTHDLVNDKDYMPSKFNIPGSYNYLDPNYMPSSVP